MSNKPKHSKTNITKISAKSSEAKATTTITAASEKPDVQPVATLKTQEVPENPETQKSTKDQKPATSKKTKHPQKSDQNPKKDDSTEKPLKQVFILARPFVAIGRYLRDSWREIRQVRWPGRKMTWKMTFAVLIYCAIFIIFIVLLDTFFTFIFNLLINAK